MALVSPSNAPTDHPLHAFRHEWNKTSKSGRQSFGYAAIRAETMAFLDTISNLGPCVDMFSKNPSDCFCMANLDLTEDEAEATVDYLIDYFKRPFTEQRSLVAEWKRYAKILSDEMEMGRRALTSSCTKQVFLLPGSSCHRLCHNAIAKLVGKSKFAWQSIGEEGKELQHGHANKKPNNSMSETMEDKLNEYFFSLSRLGQPRATKIVRGLSADKNEVTTELKDADVDLIELPACHTKRALYRSFLYENGWEVTFDNKSRMETSTAGDNGPPISWPTFCSFWKKNFPKLIIQPQSEDLCDDCIIFANQHKYSSNKDKDEDVRDAEEDLVVAAAKHVEMARKQRLYFISKKGEAKHHADELRPQHQRTYTFVADFAQNMYVPNFAAEQPGATYYFSPLNVYPFGVVDTSTTPTMLTAFVFSEG